MSACGDQPHCRWVVRFQPLTTARDETAIAAALGTRRSVQPVQLSGDQASVLVEGTAGFEVVFLKKSKEGWAIVNILQAPETKKGAAQ